MTESSQETNSLDPAKGYEYVAVYNSTKLKHQYYEWGHSELEPIPTAYVANKLFSSEEELKTWLTEYSNSSLDNLRVFALKELSFEVITIVTTKLSEVKQNDA